jgi:4-diphosphocytidyl-2-C-methyl-D-erythritol kinase
VAAELAGAGVCRTVRVAHGPVPGARIIDDSPVKPPTPPIDPLEGAHA